MPKGGNSTSVQPKFCKTIWVKHSTNIKLHNLYVNKVQKTWMAASEVRGYGEAPKIMFSAKKKSQISEKKEIKKVVSFLKIFKRKRSARNLMCYRCESPKKRMTWGDAGGKRGEVPYRDVRSGNSPMHQPRRERARRRIESSPWPWAAHSRSSRSSPRPVRCPWS